MARHSAVRGLSRWLERFRRNLGQWQCRSVAVIVVVANRSTRIVKPGEPVSATRHTESSAIQYDPVISSNKSAYGLTIRSNDIAVGLAVGDRGTVIEPDKPSNESLVPPAFILT